MGIAQTAIGTDNTNAVCLLIEQSIATAATTSPISMLPVSPKYTFAGGALYRRKPTSAPASAKQASAADTLPCEAVITPKHVHTIAPIDDASPSAPSIRLN